MSCLRAVLPGLLPFLVLAAGIRPAAAAPSAHSASRVTALATANMDRVVTLSYRLVTTAQALDGTGRPLGAEDRGEEQVACDRSSGKLKWSALGRERRGYVADARAHRLHLREGGVTGMSDATPPDQVESMARPYPEWLWQPRRYLPPAPSDVTQDGPAVVLCDGATHPQTRVWLQRTTGCLLKLESTSPTGVLERTVVCEDWTLHNGVWVPGRVTEEIRGSLLGLRRVMRFTEVSVNPALPSGTFAAP